MANAHHLQIINEIAGSLSSGECRRLSYLCGSVDTDSSVAGVREMLKSQLMRCQMDDLFLLELMFALRRFDILRKVLGTSREEVERTLRQRHVLSKYRVLMADVSEDMANEDLKNLKFLLSSALPREKMDKAKNFLDVVVELEKLDKVSPERLDFVEQCLRNIGRIDLAKKVNVYQGTGGAPQQQPLVHHQIIQQQQQRPRAPFSSPTSNCSYPLHQPRQAQSQRIENFPVSVRRKQNFQSLLDCYKLNTDPRGVCVIIDCVGSDGDMLEDMFKGLHFTVVLHKWLGVSDTLSALRGIFRQRENHEAGAFICCIISRGTASGLLATDAHGDGLRLDTVRQLFTAEACPMLAGKPKLFFIQRYSVPELQTSAGMAYRDEDLETDGCDGLSTREYVPTDADVFWSHCWTDERQLEQGHHRSVYLQALTDALHKGQRRKTHLVDIHTEVNGMIYDHNKRNPGARYHIDLKHTLRKNLYLQ
ncbi:CASP8 and FADD-like apoptosis regulator [Centroberyx affinis]|uniref:CASP8 and FADD-like apoptosis regulator n=1 Tax=Centroberyx affinis TaxID=166261 RepID=UPI003A5BB809